MRPKAVSSELNLPISAPADRECYLNKGASTLEHSKGFVGNSSHLPPGA